MAGLGVCRRVVYGLSVGMPILTLIKNQQTAGACVLPAAPVLPKSKITNVPQSPVSAAAPTGISEVIADLENKPKFFSELPPPYHSSVCPVRKP